MTGRLGALICKHCAAVKERGAIKSARWRNSAAESCPFQACRTFTAASIISTASSIAEAISCRGLEASMRRSIKPRPPCSDPFWEQTFTWRQSGPRNASACTAPYTAPYRSTQGRAGPLGRPRRVPAAESFRAPLTQMLSPCCVAQKPSRSGASERLPPAGRERGRPSAGQPYPGEPTFGRTMRGFCACMVGHT